MALFDKLFWALFTVAGVGIAVYISANGSITLGALLGALLVGSGLAKLAQEVALRNVADVNKKLIDTLQWIEQGLKKLTEGANESASEEKYEMFAKKIIQLENRINEVSRSLTAEILDMKNSEVEVLAIEKTAEKKDV